MPYSDLDGGGVYGFTFGVYDQTSAWNDVRALTWPALSTLLTEHPFGQKEGTCIVPAVFTGPDRKKAQATQIDVAFLDSDQGTTLDEIRAAIVRRGWAAIISSTHSHGTTRTKVKRDAFEKFAARHRDPDSTAEAFLIQEKGYRAAVAQGAKVVGQTDEHVVLEHAPCPKFRIAIPLLRPWRADNYASQDDANDGWKERIEALAAELGLDHDQSCTDTSRLFFLPRRPQDGPEPETAVLEGAPCDLFALPAAPTPLARVTHPTGRSAVAAPADLTVTEPASREVFDLAAWARTYGRRFEIAAALRARHPAALVSYVADGCKHHIRCPNEAAHTEPGQDRSTFVVNASQSGTKGFVIHCMHNHCTGRDRLLFLKQMLEQRWLSVDDLINPDFLGEVGRPLIRYEPGDLPTIVDLAETALIESSVGLYQHGGMIVRPGQVPVAINGGRTVSAQRIVPVGDHAIAEAMTKAASWEKLDKRANRWVRIDAPPIVAQTYRDRVGLWQLPVLSGIITAPTLRADGTILDRPGYDGSTGLLYEPGATSFPTIRSAPSMDDAVRSLLLLEELIGTFPFIDAASRAVALSAIMTACIRRALPTAPLHAFTAPTAGSGKSLLVDLASVIATGREASVMAQGKSEEELEKRLGALLLAGDLVIAIDNCEAPLGGDLLCSMLTQPMVRVRILGRSEASELPAAAFVAATGNNLALLGDLTRRSLLCTLDPGEERPELRRFEINPLDLARADRGSYVGAALTVLRAYHVAGRPGAPEPLGSFEAWSGWVRGALLWLGRADPVTTMEAARARDPKLDALLSVTSQWQQAFGVEAVSVRAVIERAAGGGDSAQSTAPDLREALLTVAGESGAINSRRLGKWLAANEGRVVNGRRLQRANISVGIQRWRLVVDPNAAKECNR